MLYKVPYFFRQLNIFVLFLSSSFVALNFDAIRISSEDLVSDVGRILFIKGLQEADSGQYTCTAVYTSSQKLEARVNLTTIGM